MSELYEYGYKKLNTSKENNATIITLLYSNKRGFDYKNINANLYFFAQSPPNQINYEFRTSKYKGFDYTLKNIINFSLISGTAYAPFT